MKKTLQTIQTQIENKLETIPDEQIEENIFEGKPLPIHFEEEQQALENLIDAQKDIDEDLEYLLANALMDLDSFPSFALQTLEEAIDLLQ